MPAGAGRWASDRVWLFDFRDPLPPGTRCEARLRADWKPVARSTSAGAPASAAISTANAASLSGKTEFTFSTGGPAVVSVQPGNDSDIEEEQHFLLRLSGPAVESSVVANAWCEVEGIGERLPVRIVGGDVREQILKARHIDKAHAANTLVLRCDRPLPNDTAMRLVWGKGIAAAANPRVVTSIEQRFRYRVRSAFTADFSCERERAAAPCLPIRPMTVRFSALGAARAGSACAPCACERRGAGTDLRQGRQGGRSSRDRVSKAARRKRGLHGRSCRPSLKDNAGRPLANAASFPLKVATGAAPPIAKFAAAPFGVIERDADAMLPVTLRHVQGDLRAQPVPRARRVVAKCATRSCTSDADILAWYARLQKYHETQLSAKELGWPQNTWFTTETDTDAKGRPDQAQGRTHVRHARTLAARPGRRSPRRLDLPQLTGGDPRPFEVIGIPLAEPGYHVVEIESLRLGQSLLDKQRADVRAHRRARHQPRRPLQARAREQPWSGSRRSIAASPSTAPTSSSTIALGRPLWSGRTDAQGPRGRGRSALDAQLRALPGRPRLFRQRLRRRAAAPTSPSSSAAGRRASSRGASTLPTGARRRARPACLDRLRPHAVSRRRNRLDEALHPRRDARLASRYLTPETLPTRVQDRASRAAARSSCCRCNGTPAGAAR